MKALVLLAHGTEEMEAVITCDILSRGGIDVIRASVENESVLTCANGMKIVADVHLKDQMDKLSNFNIIVLPGGMKGTETFCDNENVQSALKHFSKGQYVAAICAAPLALRQAEVFQNYRITCYPGLESNVTRDKFFTHDVSANTIIDGKLITSRGPGTAIDFALNIVQALKGESVKQKVASGLLVQ